MFTVMFFFSLMLILFSPFLLKFFSLNFGYFSAYSSLFNNFTFGFASNFTSFCFLGMVGLVTCTVLLYSEIYMEHYNNKKFIFILILFFSSMLLLSLSDTLLVLMIGWDGLGVSSICLIMFYPNKNTLYNSLLTMFFNRLGDVILILGLSLLILDPSIFYSFCDLGSIFFFIILACALTKSAQFPLSSWLPAAMSAPTPISAMVHSSTLVTAGVFVCLKCSWSMGSLGALDYLLYLSLTSFLLGGFMANLELDLKKTIAFSTMSQISMILMFVASLVIFLAVSHMIFHAFFKTLLFCCAGLFFVHNFSDQLSLGIKNFTFLSLVSALFILSIYGMTGLVFSSSFFSKDLVLELMCSTASTMIFMFFFLGSCLTIFYCSKLSVSVMSFPWSVKSIMHKYSFYSFVFIFSLLVVFSGVIFKSMVPFSFFPFVSNLEVFSIFLVFSYSLVKNFPQLYYFVMIYLSLTVAYMKIYTFSMLSKFMDSQILNLSFSDTFIFKPYIFVGPLVNLTSRIFYFKGASLMILFSLIVYLLVYPVSLLERSLEDAKDKG